MSPFINRLRGLLAIGVALSHIPGIFSAYGATPDAFQNFMLPFFMFSGFNYVIGFIVLSGYCIARSTLSRADNFSLLQYTKRRVTRIYPTLIVCCIIAGLVEWTLLGSASRVNVWNTGQTLQVFFINLSGMAGFYGQFGSFSPSYTVSFELLFYVVWGVVFAISPKPFAVPVSIAAGLALYHQLGAPYQFALVLFASWLLGAALAVHEEAIVNMLRRVPLWAVWGSFLIAFIYGNQLVMQSGLDIWAFPGDLVTVPLGLLFTIVIGCHLAKDGKAMQMDNWLGNISYPLFLVHGPIMLAVASTFKSLQISLSFGALSAVLMGSSLLAAQLIFMLVERPVMRMRRSI